MRLREWSAPRRAVSAVVHLGNDRRARPALAATTAALVRPGSVISHESAAILYWLPVRDVPDVAMLTVPRGSRVATESVD